MLSGITAMAVHRVTPLPNLVGQGGFFVHPRDQFLALRRLRDDGCLLVATYHSHPFGAPELSALDIRLLARWRCAHLVVVPAARTEPDRVAAYWIESTGPRRIEFRISPDLRGIVCAAETEGA
jgi:proteasome lid subunit RPN8/RPN11